MDYAARLNRIQLAMQVQGIDALFLPRGANLFYLTGIRRQLEHGTDHNAYGDWLSGGYLAPEGPIEILAPRMGGEFWQQEAANKPWIGDVELIREPVDPADVLRDKLASLGLASGRGRLAVDERTWAQFAIEIRNINENIQVINANEIIAPMRMIKEPEELAVMQKASELTDQVFAYILPQLHEGVTEFDIAHEIDRQLVLLGSEYTSFVTGVFFIADASTTGADTTRAGQRALRRGDSIMFDFGGLVEGYASDFGRTAFFGEPSSEYQLANDAVIDAQAAAMKGMIAGECTAADANAIARRVIAEAGHDDGFWHRLGHGIGVTVHEPPFLDGVDTTVLQENMVFTVEPSIIQWDRFGTRIEDMVVITDSGGIPMSKVDRKLFLINE